MDDDKWTFLIVWVLSFIQLLMIVEFATRLAK